METGQEQYFRAWMSGIKAVEEETRSAWEILKNEFEVTVADSEQLANSAILQWEKLKKLIGELPKEGRISYLKDMFDVDDTKALEILNYINKVKDAAQREEKDLSDYIQKMADKSSEKRIEAFKKQVETILSWDHLSYKEQIERIKSIAQYFEGTEEEKMQIAKIVAENISELRTQKAAETRKNLKEQQEQESKERISNAEETIEKISINERKSVQQRIQAIRNYLDAYQGTEEEKTEITRQANEEIVQLEKQLATELREKAQALPEGMDYKDRLNMLETFYQQRLEIVEGNLEAELALEEEYAELKQMLREQEIERVRNYYDEIYGLVSGFLDEAMDVLSEGGEQMGVRLVESFFNYAESVSGKLAEQYLVDPILDAIAEATVEAQEEGENLGETIGGAVSAAISGNVAGVIAAAVAFDLKQIERTWNQFWDNINKIQNEKLRNFLYDVMYFLGMAKEEIESIEDAFEQALSSATTFDEFSQNLEDTIRERVKQGLIQAFLETAAMQAIFEKIAKALDKALADGEISDKEWAKIEKLMAEANDKAKEFWEHAGEWFENPEDLGLDRTDTVKSITEKTANVLLAIERSSNLYLKEMNENIRIIRNAVQNMNTESIPNTAYNVQQNMRAIGA
jgi:hypothetical protein